MMPLKPLRLIDVRYNNADNFAKLLQSINSIEIFP